MKKMIIIGLTALWLSACSDLQGSNGRTDENFPKISRPYNSEQAIQNGDVVNVHGQLSNMDKWHQFLKNIEANKADKVRITQYTIEGDPIFYELIYNGESIHYTFDNSMDAYGSNQGRPSTTCKGMGTKKNEQGNEYYILKDCDNETGKTFWFHKK
ncbi:DUF4362 domain-containing protein [Paenibacillus sp. SC116]|uniref:DUF4362 domain-containing protein n=1 Tax=Paenibacillus sp. SC116 TaxID=2968986 RepID=UPI00215A19CA|nr:DUF4362 domain-containing protein [Paenibacillus sp. SC116]MCR8842342.1 DUF4362 domain-containing protein [Paenibacillus sp. SC116]